MHTLDPRLAHARALRADLLAAPSVWLPRREVILDWLSDLVRRATAPNYAFAATESDDLVELERYLRTNNVPVVK